MYFSDYRYYTCGVNSPQADDVAGVQALYNTGGNASYGNLAQNVEWGVNPSSNSNCNVHFQMGTIFGVAYAKIKMNSGNCISVKVFVNTAGPAFGSSAGTWYQSAIGPQNYFAAVFYVYMVPNNNIGPIFGQSFCVGYC